MVSETKVPMIVISEGPLELKRNIGLCVGTAFVLGTIVGTGVFLTPPILFYEAGSVGLGIVALTLGGVLSMMGVFIFAELGSLVSRSGGEYAFFQEVNLPLVAFLFAWTKAILLTPSIVAIMGLMFARYITAFRGGCGDPDAMEKIIAILLILTICIVNIRGTKISGHIQVVLSLTTLLAVAVVGVTGIVNITKGQHGDLPSGFRSTKYAPNELALTFYQVMTAYDGWNSLHYLTEELKNPHKTLWRASIIGVVIAATLYILSNVSFVAGLGLHGVISSKAVATDWSKAMLGPVWPLIPAAVLVSVLGTTNGVFFSFGRICYTAARDHLLPEIISYVHVTMLTPVPALLMTCTISIVMLLPSGVEALLNVYAFSSWLFYGLATVTLIIMRFTKKEAERAVKVHWLVVVTFLLICGFLVVAPVVQKPRMELLVALAVMGVGLLYYIPFVVFKVEHRIFAELTLCIQLLCNVAPSSKGKKV